MFDALFPLRMAQTTSELMLQSFSRSVGFWTQAASRTMVPLMAGALPPVASAQPRVRSWYRHPDEPVVPMPWEWFKYAWNPLLAPRTPGLAANIPFPFPNALGAAAPLQVWPLQMWQSWQRLLPVPAAARAWPLACFFMGAGMPSAAAWPVAEAGTHMLDATMKAAEGMQELFSTYRSEGGHATAQIIRPRRLH